MNLLATSVPAIAVYEVLPYVALTIGIAGLVWSRRSNQFSWTARSTELLEGRVLRYASIIFHLGVLAAIGGHVIGILIPRSWTDAVGISETAYHVLAIVTGAIAGFCTLAGLAILIYRRRTVGPVFSATTKNDKFMYVVLTATILFGLSNTVLG
ncbi:MAG: respiratory nitrate reductase subunit gamma, partial [Actinomycetota bacterium]|nr:respiratory nitrate reductase subunit gamma [Actinomycetota bacterium]